MDSSLLSRTGFLFAAIHTPGLPLRRTSKCERPNNLHVSLRVNNRHPVQSYFADHDEQLEHLITSRNISTMASMLRRIQRNVAGAVKDVESAFQRATSDIQQQLQTIKDKVKNAKIKPRQVEVRNPLLISTSTSITLM
jgi:hypothetical protein